MGWKEFVVKLVEALAWPAAAVTIVLLFRSALALGGLLLLSLVALWNKLPPQLLEIRFDPDTVQTPVAVENNVVVANSRWFHFHVHSKARIHNCQGRLILLEKGDGAGNYKRVPQFKPPVNLTLDSVSGLTWRAD
jgi:hypothetical protein